ncbi:MAG: ABC transporter permease [Treponema sp.]|nr:ABC transporter permease [Treponema sp.]
MNITLSVIHIAAPLLLVTLGGLISEYAGRMAMFLECMINLGAFLCYACTLWTGNLVAGILLSVLLCTLIVFAIERIASRYKANMFLISLAMNMFFAALASFLSATIFGSRGVLYHDLFRFDATIVRPVTTIICYALAATQILMLKTTTAGLTLRVTGSDSDVLQARGISAARYRTVSWLFAAANASLAGCVLAARLSSYVPGMAGGRGWTALAAVYLGKKHPILVALSVLVFSAAEYASSTVQNITLFKNVPSSVLLALPYLVALALIVIVPQKKEG